MCVLQVFIIIILLLLLLENDCGQNQHEQRMKSMKHPETVVKQSLEFVITRKLKAVSFYCTDD